MTNDNDARGALTEIAKAAWDEAWRLAFDDGLSAGHPLGRSRLDRETEWADSEVVARIAKLPAGDGLTLTDEERKSAAYLNNVSQEGFMHHEHLTPINAFVQRMLAAPRQPGEMGAGVQPVVPSFDCSLAATDSHDPQSFIDGAKWAQDRLAAASAQQDEREADAKALKDASEWLLDVMGDWDFTIPNGAFDKIVVYIAKGDHNG